MSDIVRHGTELDIDVRQFDGTNFSFGNSIIKLTIYRAPRITHIHHHQPHDLIT